MSYYSGHSTQKIKTFSRKEFVNLCCKARNEGFELHKRKVKRDWPRFWRIKYKAEYRRYYIIDEANIAFIPKEQLEYIETGRIR